MDIWANIALYAQFLTQSRYLHMQRLNGDLSTCTEAQWRSRYLHRGDGSFLSGGNSLLHGAHVSGQCWLVAHSRGNATQQGRHLEGRRRGRERGQEREGREREGGGGGSYYQRSK